MTELILYVVECVWAGLIGRTQFAPQARGGGGKESERRKEKSIVVVYQTCFY